MAGHQVAVGVRRKVGARAAPALLGVLGLATFALVLEVAPRLGVVPAEYAPPTSRVLAAAGDQMGRPEFWAALVDTLITWAVGLGIAVAAGVVVGVVIGATPFLRAATATTIEFLRPIPSVALIPLVIVLYGSTIRSTVVLVVYAAFWQVLVQVLYGVADVDPVARDTAQSYGLGRWYRLRYLLWPTALPYVVTGVRLAAVGRAHPRRHRRAGDRLARPGQGDRPGAAGRRGARRVRADPRHRDARLLANVGMRLWERLLAWHPSARREVTAA